LLSFRVTFVSGLIYCFKHVVFSSLELMKPITAHAAEIAAL
jgi:hypothetical protein